MFEIVIEKLTSSTEYINKKIILYLCNCKFAIIFIFKVDSTFRTAVNKKRKTKDGPKAQI